MHLKKTTCQNTRSLTFGNEENWIVLPTIFGGVLVWLEVTFTLISDPVSSSSSSLISRGSLGFPSRKAKCLDKIEATCESPVIRWNCLLKRNYEKKSLIWREILSSLLKISRFLRTFYFAKNLNELYPFDFFVKYLLYFCVLNFWNVFLSTRIIFNSLNFILLYLRRCTSLVLMCFTTWNLIICSFRYATKLFKVRR